MTKQSPVAAVLDKVGSNFMDEEERLLIKNYYVTRNFVSDAKDIIVAELGELTLKQHPMMVIALADTLSCNYSTLKLHDIKISNRN